MRHSVAIGNQINDHFVLDLNGQEGDGDSSDPSRRSFDLDELMLLSTTRGGLTSPPHTMKTRSLKQSYDSTGSGGGADDESSSVSSSTTDGLNSPVPGEVDDLHVAFEQKI